MPASNNARAVVRAHGSGFAPDAGVPGMSGCTSPSVSDGVAVVFPLAGCLARASWAE